MIAVLQSDDNDLDAAIEALESLGKDAAPAAPALTKLLSHETPRIRAAGGEALWSVDPKAAEAAGLSKDE